MLTADGELLQKDLLERPQLREVLQMFSLSLSLSLSLSATRSLSRSLPPPLPLPYSLTLIQKG